MNSVQKDLVSLIEDSLFKKGILNSPTDEVLAEARKHTVDGLISKKAYNVYVNSIRSMQAHAELSSILDSIPFVTIKGCASASYYPRPLQRTMGDIDFLVYQKDFNNAEIQLLKAGFIKIEDGDTSFHSSYMFRGLVYEMHREINGIHSSALDIQSFHESLMETKCDLETDGGVVRIPDDFHNGWICLLHIIKHFTNDGIGLRHFCDWACFVNKIDNFQDMFEDSFKASGVWNFARIVSLTAVKYIGLPYQEWMGSEEEDILDLFMDEVMISGNFGMNGNRKGTTWFISVDGRNSRIKQFILTINMAVENAWPTFVRLPIILPLGWIFLAIKYIYNRLFKKRERFPLVKAFIIAKQRNFLLKKMQLFK